MYKNKKLGQSAIEWGVMLPFLILIIASVLELAPLMNTIMVVDKSTQYAARLAAVKGTPNEDVIFAYEQNMQGLMPIEEFLEKETDPVKMTERDWRLPGNCEGNPRCELKRAESTVTRDPATNKTVTNTTNSKLTIVGPATENNVILNTIEVVPGAVSDRFSSAWVMVGAKHEYRILTPVLQAVLSGKCDTGKKGVFLNYCNYFPITKTSVYRVE